MNKKIIFNTSSLLSLKAELLKKQEEVVEKKRLPQNKVENFKISISKKLVHETTEQKKQSFGDHLKNIDNEDLEAYKKTKIALQKKTELYDHLSNPAGDSQLSERFLVDFSTKKQEVKQSLLQNDKKDLLFETVEHTNTESFDQDEWVEFTDCLGRSRKCHYSDLDFYKKRDEALLQNINKDQSLEGDKHDKPCEIPLLVQKTNEYLQSLREKWEQQEKELLSKDKDVHYQDLLFDEARMHGVGYYSFSTDESERCKQMEELIKRREETLKAQKEAEEVRRKREQLIEARVAAARARQRARAGLPPEEPKENTKDFTTCLMEFLTQQKNEADSKAVEEEKRVKEQQEQERQKLREVYVREWDIGKEGVEEKLKKFREMTQEEYVEQQRTKRIDEFAPPTNLFSNKCESSFDERGKSIGLSENRRKKSWSDVRTKKMIPQSSAPDFDEDASWNGGLYFSSRKKTHKISSYEEDPVTAPTPIEDELIEDICLKESEKRLSSHKAQIAPPPTYEYYGPSPKRSKTQKPNNSNISEAYEQGLKSLESKNNTKSFSKRYDFIF